MLDAFYSMEQRVLYLIRYLWYEKQGRTLRRSKSLARANCILSVVSYVVYTVK